MAPWWPGKADPSLVLEKQPSLSLRTYWPGSLPHKQILIDESILSSFLRTSPGLQKPWDSFSALLYWHQCLLFKPITWVTHSVLLFCLNTVCIPSQSSPSALKLQALGGVERWCPGGKAIPFSSLGYLPSTEAMCALFTLADCILFIFSKQTGEVPWESTKLPGPFSAQALCFPGGESCLFVHFGVMCSGTLLFSNEAPAAAHVIHASGSITGRLRAPSAGPLFSRQS